MNALKFLTKSDLYSFHAITFNIIEINQIIFFLNERLTVPT